jgi:uracil phosphoribosyltransferase
MPDDMPEGGTMSTLQVIEHPLVQHKAAMMRDKDTNVKDFRELVKEIAILLGYEVTRDLPLVEAEIETPLEKMKVKVLPETDLAIVPILRAGLGMVDGFLSLVPNAKVGFVGLYRDPDTHKPVEYYCKLPDDIEKRRVVVLDPMLATGGSASAAIRFVKDKGAKDIKFVCIIAAPEGVKVLQDDHPDVDIIAARLDRELNSHAYILPGLGDAGDRIYGTK